MAGRKFLTLQQHNPSGPKQASRALVLLIPGDRVDLGGDWTGSKYDQNMLFDNLK